MSIHPHFTLVGIEPGMVITFQFGAVDFRETIPLEILEKLYNDGFPYLKLTKQGQKAMLPTIIPISPAPVVRKNKEAVSPKPTRVGEPVEPNPNKKNHARKSK